MPPEAEQHTRDAYFLGADTFDPQTGSWYCVLRLGTRPVGGLALTRYADDQAGGHGAGIAERNRAGTRARRCRESRARRRLARRNNCARPFSTLWRINSKHP